MRRRTPGVLKADELLDEAIVRAESERAARVVTLLEPFVQERRRARIKEVIARRLRSVQVIFDPRTTPPLKKGQKQQFTMMKDNRDLLWLQDHATSAIKD